MEICPQLPLGLLSSSRYEPQGSVYLWEAGLVWLNAISDSAIVLAYYCIPFSLLWYVRQKKDLGFRSMYVGFAVFIFACGTTHLFGIWNIWHTDYWPAALTKAITAVISVFAAIRLYRILPTAIQVPSPVALQQLNESLVAEVETRKTTQARMNDLTEQLERRVAERTEALQTANLELQRQVQASNRAKDALQESEELFSRAFRDSPDCLAIVRLSDRTVVRANETVARLWGSTPEKLIGKPTREYSTWGDENDRIAFMQELRETGECLNHEAEFRLSDGRTGRFNVSTRLITIKGEECALSVMTDITERKKAEVTAAWLAGIVEFSEDAIIGRDMDGIVTSWNAAAERILGYTAAEMIGHPINRLLPPSRQDEDEQTLARIRQGESVRSMETIRLRKNGDPIEVSLTVSPIKDASGRTVGVSKIIRDISEQKQAAEARRATEARYRTLFDYAPDGIVIASAEGSYLDANRSMCRMLGYPRDELIGLHSSAVVADSEVQHIKPAIKTIHTRSDYHREWLFKRKDGTLFSAEVIATLMPDGNLLALIRDVTERKNAEHIMREKDRRLHSADRRLAEIMHGMNEACFALDEQWCFTFVNDRGETLLKHSREQLLGRSIWEVFSKLVGTPMEKKYRRAMQERTPVAFEAFSPIAERWLDIRLFPTPEGLAAFLLDIHERKQAELALRSSQEEFKDLFDNAPIGYHEVDNQGRLVRINQAELRMLGYSAGELEGRYVWEMAVDPETSRQAVLEKLAGAPPLTAFERVLKRKDGSTVPVLIEDRLVRREDGSVIGIRAVIQDVTERKLAEEKIQKLNSDLERRVAERTAQLEVANKELEAFSYSVSHDLRAPLRAVDGFSQAVFEDFGSLLPAQGQRQLQTIRESAQRMGELIDDLLSFSRLSRQTLRKQPVEMKRLVAAVLDDLKNERNGRDVEIKLGELPTNDGDSALLKQVWINLISNALKYTRRRERALIEIGAAPGPQGDVYYIRDNGTGFDMRYANKLFGVFQRLHRAEDYEGTGVGLAIVQRVVHRHGGKIWAEAAVNQGATFYFTLNGEFPHE